MCLCVCEGVGVTAPDVYCKYHKRRGRGWLEKRLSALVVVVVVYDYMWSTRGFMVPI